MSPALRNPAFTGANRCLPCTVLNLVVVALLAGLVFVLSPVASLFVGTLGVVAIYLRGYVVPGTPVFGPRIAAYLPVRFDHTTEFESDSLAGDVPSERLVQRLTEAGILVVDGDKLLLARSFEEAWEGRMRALRRADDAELLDRAATLAGDSVEGEFLDDRILLTGDGRDAMLRPAVAIAETAAAETLAEYGVPEHVRVPAAGPLKTVLRSCPVCGGAVEETTIQNCCGGPGSIHANPERAALACTDCETVVHVFE